MLIFPIETTDHADDAVVVVLGSDNVERMAVGDPAEIDWRASGFTLVNPRILLCYEKDQAALMRVIQTKDIRRILKYLSRGFKDRPEKGDGEPARKLYDGN
jgi:hypothetical protein